MTIEKKLENKGNANILTMKVDGRLDTTTAPDLEAAVSSSLTDVNTLILDFEALEYISSAGLRVLLQTQKAMSKQETMKIIHVNEEIMEVFAITGFVDILTIA